MASSLSISKKRRVGVFGGSFDPPHIGHMWVISSLLNSGIVDEVLVVPSNRRSDRAIIAPAWSRVEMVERAVGQMFPNDERVSVSSIELDDSRPIEGTIELIDSLQELNGDAHYLVVIGADLIASLPQWKHQERLKKLEFLVIPRGRDKLEVTPYYNLLMIDTPMQLPISASSVRKLLHEGALVGGLTVMEWLGNHIEWYQRK